MLKRDKIRWVLERLGHRAMRIHESCAYYQMTSDTPGMYYFIGKNGSVRLGVTWVGSRLHDNLSDEFLNAYDRLITERSSTPTIPSVHPPCGENPNSPQGTLSTLDVDDWDGEL